MKTTKLKLTARTLLAATGLMIASACTVAQPQNQPENKPDHQNNAPQVESNQGENPQRGRFDGSRLRESLKKAIEDMKRAQQDAEASLAQLEKGTAPVEVARDLSPELRRFLRDNLPGPMGGNGPRMRGGPEGPDGPMGQGGPGGRQRMDRPDGMRRGPDGPDGPDGGDDRGPRDRMNGGPEGRRALSPEAREEVLRLLREHAPDVANDFDSLRKEDERMADGLAQRIAPRIHEAMMLRERDPEMFRLKVEELRGGLQVLRAIREFRQAKNMSEDNADMIAARKTRLDAAEVQLRKVVSDTLDLRLKAHERELTMLERRVEDVRKDLDEKRSKKNEGVDKLVERIKKGDMPAGLFGPGPERPDGPKPMRGEGPENRPGPR